MCRGGKDGRVRRCKRGEHGKINESFQKALYYQAKINGVTIDEWVSSNPESFKTLSDKRDSRLLVTDSELESKSSPGYKLLHERRTYSGILDLEEYKEDKADYCQNLNLTERQETALNFYGNDMFNPLNKYFLEKHETEVFNDSAAPWTETEDGYQTYFSDEDDLLDFASELDVSLSHRSPEKKTLYRGMGVHEKSSLFVNENGEKFTISSLDDQKTFLTNSYAPGTEITFDAYASASDYVGVGAEWSGIDTEPYKTQKESIGILYEMKTNAGLPIAHLSDNDHEREILLPRGMKYKVAQAYWNDDNQYSFDFLEETADSSSLFISKGKTFNPRTLIVQLVEVDEHGEEIDTTDNYEAPALIPRAFR